jgi:hypothetical protein
MKFGRLLASGKSLVNGDVSGRYRMEKNLRLPKFISPRNPFKQEAAAEPTAPPSVVAAPAKTTVVADVLPPAKKISLSVRVGGGLQKAILFCLDHNPFSAIGKPKLSGIPRFGKPAQTELALDRAKAEQGNLASAR